MTTIPKITRPDSGMTFSRGRWLACYQVGTRRVQKSLNTRDPDIARKRRDALFAELRANGAMVARPRGRPPSGPLAEIAAMPLPHETDQRIDWQAGYLSAVERARAAVKPNVKEHATLSAGASVDHGVDVETTEDHVNRAADRGCCVSSCSLLFILLGWCGLFGSTLRAEEAHELLHLVEPLRQVCGGNSAITERLDNLQLLDEEVIERVNFRSVDLGLEHARSPLLGGFQMVLPVGDGGFQCKLAEMPDVSGIGIKSVSLGISKALPPTVDDNSKGANEGTHNDTNSRRNYPNALYIFLFLWGHEWWVLTLWWGLLVFIVIVHVDWIYGLIYEWKISSTNAIGEARADS